LTSDQASLQVSDIEEEARFTGSQINYYFVCKRKLWLFSHNIELEPESDLVKLGKLLHENRYKRKMKEVQVDRIKVDFMERAAPGAHHVFDRSLGNIAPSSQSVPKENEPASRSQNSLTIHEVKRSKKMQDAHLFQLLYYIYYLSRNYGVNVSKGVLHYPLLKQNVDVELTEERTAQIEEAIRGIVEVNLHKIPPEATWKGYCRNCAYRDLCWG
jgi:CRISPR-associated exonuclease Cas4